MKSAAPKRVLLFVVDQWRGDTLRILGHPQVSTPNLDRLIADGVTFRRHYCQATPCGPARASLLTGMYMMNHRVVRNGTPLDARHTNLALESR
ncbi:MAG: sulfatase-like hydrolase/transferase, partial [Burkholderiales bacterium]|nr:sulfatase-like hydrolase/transferase [Burkholderiales bacterium]